MSTLSPHAMRPLRHVVPVFALLALAAASSRPDPCAATTLPLSDAGALAIEHVWIRAITARDSSTLACVLAPDFVDTSWRGTLRRRAAVLAALHAPIILAQRYDDWSVQRFDRTAVVRGRNTISDASGTVVARLRFTDIFRWHDGHWQAEAAEETQVAPPAP